MAALLIKFGPKLGLSPRALRPKSKVDPADTDCFFCDEKLGEVQVYPDRGTVSFSAGLHGWAFTLTTFAEMYAKKFGVDIEKMMNRLWGDIYFNPKEKKFITAASGSAPKGLERTYCMFCVTPISKVRKCPSFTS